ncbi:MAG TPA: DUF6152 family protein [Candidatus Acidoferrales bacterium]|nr:DUF6152 family protein [Candidatus Acidoferrales bacterium]
MWRFYVRGPILRVLIAVAGLGIVANPIFAHHGVTNYDMKKTIMLNGTVTDFDWSNPHCLAHVDVTDESGHTSHWTLEMASTFTMTHHGWEMSTLKRGDQVKIETHPAKNGATIGITSGPGFTLKVVVNGKELPS